MTDKWTSADVPGQSGRVAIVTGSNTARSHDEALQRRLWSVSEELTDVSFPI